MSDDVTTEPLSDAPAEAAGPGDRRRFLTKGALAAAAAAAGAIALSDTAEAANGANIIIGANNSGSTGTSLTQLNASQFRVNTGLGTFAIQGIHDTEVGVYGTAGNSALPGIGVRGRNTTGGRGVYGDNAGSTAGIGVHGFSEQGIGVVGEGGTSSLRGIGIEGRSILGPSLKLNESGLSIPPSGSWAAGSFMVDGGHVWYCYKAGSGAAAGWVKLSGAPVILNAGYRAYDSRPGEAPLGVAKGVITDGTVRNNIDLKVNGGSSAIPAGISAAIVNLTATQTSSAGFFGLFKQGVSWPGTSTLNWSAVQTNIANTTIVPVDAQSRVAVRGAGSAHCIIDVIGFLP